MECRASRSLGTDLVLRPFRLVPQPVHFIERRLRGVATLLGETRFDMAETAREFRVRPAQCRLRIDLEMPRDVGHHEQHAAHIEEEFGDLLFVMANLARHLHIDPEAALRAANAKFTRRFARIEDVLADGGKTPGQSDLAEMDALWNRAKHEEKARKPG